MRSIFISHTTADKPLATLFSETLRLGGVPAEHIFYSAQRSTGIPAGEQAETYPRERVRSAKLMLELISETFLTRPMCLMELGGAWALDLPTFPIAVPPLKPMDIAGRIGNFHTHKLSDESAVRQLFDELHDRVEQASGLRIANAGWGEAVDSFLTRLPSALAAGRADEDAPHAGTTDHGDGLVSSNYVVAEGSFGTEVRGELENTSDSERSLIILSATFYENGANVGVATGTVSKLGAHRKKTFTLDSADHVPTHDRVSVQVDNWM